MSKVPKIELFNSNNDLVIYPNHAEKINLLLNNLKENNFTLKIYNVEGMLLMNKNYSVTAGRNIEPDLNNFSHGFYVLNLTTDKININKKFMVK